MCGLSEFLKAVTEKAIYKALSETDAAVESLET
jgi:hypothetical protein